MSRRAVAAILPITAALALGACADRPGTGSDHIEISGSSTVAPITSLVAREGRFDVTVQAEGTGSGFERFCAGESAINNASTAIPGAGSPTDFVAACADAGVEYIELPIGLDAISVVRNEQADFADDLTTEELARLWAKDSTVSTWSQLRPEWPDEPIGLYGRPQTSGTYASFSNVITGQADGLRQDHQTTDDLAQLASWIADDPHGLGYMGAGNYLSITEQHLSRVTTVAVDGVQPSLNNTQSGAYGALARPLFLYVSTSALEENDAVGRFVDYYLANASSVLPRTYFYPLDPDLYPRVQERLEARTTGTMFGGDAFATTDLSEVL